MDMTYPNFIRKFLKGKELAIFYKNFIHSGDLCFDIGANRGERTDAFVKLGAQVVAVEPQKKCIELLTKKYKKNTEVNILHCALGSYEREDNLMICDESDECSTLSSAFVNTYTQVSGFHWNNSEKIQVSTLQTLINQFGIPVFCKIDVEGYESEVLKGLKTPIGVIAFEFNKPLLNDTNNCLEILSALGNYHCNFIQYEKMKLVLTEWMPLKDFKSNLRKIIGENTITGEILVKHDNY